MSTLRTSILIAWGVFWAYWLISAFGAKRGTRPTIPPGLIVGVPIIVLIRVFGPKRLAVHAMPLEVLGAIVFVCGLGLAVWARVHLGRNWGMPMTRKDEPELVTSGPYERVRHPIYSGILLAMVGSALATNLYWLIALAIAGAYFVYSARVEEQLLSAEFPDSYPGYRSRTKMLIPFLL